MSVERMKKLTVFSTRADTDPLVRRLMHMRCVNIESGIPDPSLPELELLDCAAERGELEERVRRIDEALVALHKFTKKIKSMTALPVVAYSEFMEKEYDEAWGIVEEALAVKTELASVTKRIDEVTLSIAALTPWQRYDMPLSYAGTDRTAALYGCFPTSADTAVMRDELTAAGGALEVVFCDDKNLSYGVVLCHKRDERAVLEQLSRIGFGRLGFKGFDRMASDEIKSLERELLSLEKDGERLENRLRELAGSVSKAETLRDAEATALKAVENKQKLLSDKSVTMLTGWTPAKAVGKVSEYLEKQGCAYSFEDPAEGEDAPILLHNNPFSANFEWVVGMYSYPKYGRFDPTTVMSIFYFIIFGIMFADVGYGLVTVLACFGGVMLLKPKPGLKRSMLMFGYCGISSIVFGVLFGGWFGDMPFAIMTNMLGFENAKQIYPFLNGALFNPMDEPILFLIFSLAVGFVHIIAGMAVKFYILRWRTGMTSPLNMTIRSWSGIR